MNVTWKDMFLLHHEFPNLHLEDKVVLDGWVNDADKGNKSATHESGIT